MNKQDLREQCLLEVKAQASSQGISKQVTVQGLEQDFCAVCRNDTCSNARYGEPPWVHRMLHQVERLFEGQQANPNDPRFSHIVRNEFQDMAQHATRLILSAQRGDWEIPDVSGVGAQPLFQPPKEILPSEGTQDLLKDMADGVQVVDLQQPQRPTLLSGEAQEAPLKGVAEVLAEDTVDPPYPLFTEGLTSVDTTPEPVRTASPRPQKVIARPLAGNVPQRGGLMVGGGPPPTPQAPDPWAAPPKRPRVRTKKLKVGGTFTFGAPPKNKDEK